MQRGMTNMIKLYKIKIGEKVYEVEVETVTEKEGSISTNSNYDQKIQGKNDFTQNKINNSVEIGEPIKAPMQGLIVDIKVKAGQKVKTGDEIVILEAMKMENPIVAPKDGTISAIKVSKGVNDNCKTDYYDNNFFNFIIFGNKKTI